MDLARWLDEGRALDGHWYVKRLSGNDTQANGSHQAGPYVPNEVAFLIFPELHDEGTLNPRISLSLAAGSHPNTAPANIIWYNNRLFGRTRNETRITRLGGLDSPLLDPENTGAIALFLFLGDASSRECRYWVCRDELEEDVAEGFAGPVEPGRPLYWGSDGKPLHEQMGCRLKADQMPGQWFETFPTPKEVLDKALSMRPYDRLPSDERIMRRRECEYDVFKSIEHVVESETIKQGFESIDAFVRRAQRILQRRKARSGRSLELQLCNLLDEEGISYTFQPTTESGKRPDFILPSQDAYDNRDYPAQELRMLAAKSTVKERWRQILSEADRIPTKHLFTLREGVSEGQFAQMRQADVRLVVPRKLHTKFPPSVRPELMTLQEFIEEACSLAE